MELFVSLFTSAMVQNYIKKALGAFVRHGATAIGGMLLHAGVIDSDGRNQFIGAIMVLAGLAWSFWEKKGMKLAMSEYQRLMSKSAGAIVCALALSIAMVASAPNAFAADVAQAATPTTVVATPSLTRPVPCAMSSCSGWYLGFGISGNGSNLDVVGNGVNQSVFSAGGILDIHGGYQFWNGNYFFAVEGGVGNEFAKASPIGSTVTLNTVTGYELVKIGGALSGLINPSTDTTVAGQAPIAISVPSSLSKIYMAPYFAAGAMQRSGYSQWVTGAGAEFLVASAWTMDLRYLYAPSDGTLPSTNIITIGLNRHF